MCSKKSNVIKCRLCQKAKEPVKAHTIPDFMYQELYDSDHFIKRIEISSSLEIKKPVPTGIYDSSILCRECDNNINRKCENYVSKIYYGGKGLSEGELPIFERRDNVVEGIKCIVISNLKYKKFKLFLLSILWKSSITKRPELKHVQLVIKHEEIIRKMIWDKIPGEVEDYPWFIVNFRNDSDVARQLIAMPLKNKRHGCTTYMFFIAGLIYEFYISKFNVPNYVFNSAINKNNRVIIPEVPKGQGDNILRRIYGLHS